MDRICKQSGLRILMEKTADVKVTSSVNNVPIEDALTAICKAGEIEWRKIYIKVDSPLLKKPDSLAATVRLMNGLQFPDLLVEKASLPESVVYLRVRPAVDAIPESLRKDMGMVTLYLITNDKAAREADEKANSRLERYAKLNKELMKLFMEMTPEEREQAMASGLQMLQNMDPNYMAAATQSLMKNPDMMQQMMAQQSAMLLQMPVEDRRALIRMQFQAQQFMSPELQNMLKEDAIAVLKELGITPGQQPPQP